MHDRRRSAFIALGSLTIGVVAGLRPLAALAVLSGDLLRLGRMAARAEKRASPTLRNAALVCGVGELIADKLSIMPRRTDRAGMVMRCIAGALAGGVGASARSGSPPMGAALGLLGAVGAAFVGLRTRRWIGRRLGVPDGIVGALEDAAAVSLGWVATVGVERAARGGQAVRSVPPRETARRGDILLFGGGKGFNWLIQEFGHTPFFHAAIYLGNDEIIEEQPKGVTRRTLRSSYGSHCIAVLPAPGGREVGLKALGWAETQIGDPFDPLDFYVIFLQHVFTHLHLNYAPPGRYTCAEFVSAAWEHAGVTLVPGVELSDIEPADLARLMPADVRPTEWFGGPGCN